ncbi:MAG: TonB-dependent receptor [Bacteroidetes bacterium]|nr:MAG: TonB-dependent receptor [Bacteroidota bacterium]
MKQGLILLSLLFFYLFPLSGQHSDANIFGDVQSEGEHIPFATIHIEGTAIGTATDVTGHYMLIDLEPGIHVLVASSMGYITAKREVTIQKDELLEVNFELVEETMSINEVVITGTKTFKRQTDAAVIVNVIDSKLLAQTQSCNISEGLKFQPGLRVETDCQTCNYTQLRMNGLGGGYSQILINGRPVFSPLTGLYGMEQIPANMVERIEVVRGGGSALYGSSAIGGTVNVITRIPKESSYDVNLTSQFINGGTMDNMLSGNVSMVTHKRNAGAAIFVNRRTREAYDHNGDNFSELPQLSNNSFGANLFFKPTFNQKLELSFSSLTEYRYGGEMVKEPAHMAQQSEERTHYVLMGGLDYQINFNEDNSSFIAYLAGQKTIRDHYTGIFPDDPEDILVHITDPPYGYTYNLTAQVGTQVNHRLNDFLGGTNILTGGAEYVYDDILDTIRAYNYAVVQTTGNFGAFLQSDWEIRKGITLLTGLRADKHNLVDRVIFSPRISLLYKLKTFTQFRLTWGTGFRAPQAFDSDMHIAFAGGGVSRIYLSDDLVEERSTSLSGSVNYDKATEKFIVGFTLEGFYTKLNDAFYLHPVGQDEYGNVYEKRNGSGAAVQGGTLELRGNYSKKIQLEAGYTLLTSLYDEAVEYIEGEDPKREFLRSPNQYGYLTFSVTPGDRFNASLNGVYTGPMELVHYAGAPEQSIDEYVTSNAFFEFGVKLGYTFKFEVLDSGLELFGGVKNLTNAYQNDFDTGKNRDSGYIYGPALPRTFFIGLRLHSF